MDRKCLECRSVLIIFILAFTLLSSEVSAGTLYFSDGSSDLTPASVLNAILQFDVTGSNLTATFTNNSAYRVNAIYFNFDATSNVTGLSPTDIKGWSFSTPTKNNATNADGFGMFDFALLGGNGNLNTASNQVAPNGGVETFTFSILGTGSFFQSDFIAENAYNNLAAAKFVAGPATNDPTETVEDSAFGVVPEPSTITLLGSGLICLALLGRRFRKYNGNNLSKNNDRVITNGPV